ncbi:MAG TPA: class I SAM-dependent methyltransferase [Candidatus Baltobacteraceae bacterium]|nr:class I SAM-dependent methyltransferase [Candidatus Baltobacteraceae bacterium]
MSTIAAPTSGALEPAAPTATPRCRFCGTALTHTLVDLGMSPLCESFLAADQLDAMEPFYPLHVRVCPACLLVQLPAYVAPEAIFREYAYFSAYSDSWVEHSRRYVETISARLGLGPSSHVVELASNDGYLLQHFVAAGIPALGIEPAWNVAEAARERGVETLTEFFGLELADQLVADGRAADLVIGNNVLAQVPDLNDFVAGMAHLLKPTGVATLEFPHVVRLVEDGLFDTIYHEHFSYFSAGTIERIADAHGLHFFDVEELPTHGGSLRVYLARRDGPAREMSHALKALLAREAAGGYDRLDGYTGFAARVERVKRDLLAFLIHAREKGQRTAGYGAPGKGNTLLNYCGIRTDLVEFTVDRNPYKHGRFTPGTHIPIFAPEHLMAERPDLVLILPWNLRTEISAQLADVTRWGGRLVVAIPHLEVLAP